MVYNKIWLKLSSRFAGPSGRFDKSKVGPEKAAIFNIRTQRPHSSCNAIYKINLNLILKYTYRPRPKLIVHVTYMFFIIFHPWNGDCIFVIRCYRLLIPVFPVMGDKTADHILLFYFPTYPPLLINPDIVLQFQFQFSLFMQHFFLQ